MDTDIGMTTLNTHTPSNSITINDSNILLNNFKVLVVVVVVVVVVAVVGVQW